MRDHAETMKRCAGDNPAENHEKGKSIEATMEVAYDAIHEKSK
jgi:hypothetical protein